MELLEDYYHLLSCLTVVTPFVLEIQIKQILMYYLMSNGAHIYVTSYFVSEIEDCTA